MIDLVISGGQTGVDRAALDVAIAMGIRHGGWCPKGRRAEDGVISEKYNLTETSSEDYSERTILNIKDSDATLIFVPSIPINTTDGTRLTIKEVFERKKSYLLIDLSREQNPSKKIEEWAANSSIKILNIAGPRESQSPGIYELVYEHLMKAFKSMMSKNQSESCDKKKENVMYKI